MPIAKQKIQIVAKAGQRYTEVEKWNGWNVGIVILALLLTFVACERIPNKAGSNKNNDSLVLPDTNKVSSLIDNIGSNTNGDNLVLSGTPKLPTLIVNIAKNMKKIDGGTFIMGCISEQSNCYGDEKLTHKVTLSSYQINKYEVTQVAWRAVMGDNPSRFSGCDKCPVESVSWNDIQEFLKKLNKKTGKRYRLPTEAEWEYAARGGQSYKHAGSNTIDNVAWYSSNANSKTHDVGEKRANGYGLYDMSGNVWEWCSDKYGDYSSGAQTNPKGAGSGSNHVNRGGSFGNRAGFCRVSLRYYRIPDIRSYYLGFRLAHSSR